MSTGACLSLRQVCARCCLMFSCVRVFCHCFPGLGWLRFLGEAFRTEEQLFLRWSICLEQLVHLVLLVREDKESLGTEADQ